ncbi:hypothetical protein [Streptomyces sp. I4(2020)]|uniref:hypothetical protein n=1 Tax=Streptomyces sp. I4(2020) TaxID=2760981 RepID=UPI0018EE9C60|nr:hypothetical protein [Streptomyces sp. I4(2020)]MBJ6615560.1 hypothetical protein [Streptomyces sp. I3(2020)]MBJ6626057.1 hypothetical protein [Streptomyces sp. I4(2020)]
MALAPLATVADLEARGLAVDESEADVVNTYLRVASAAVREAAGTAISRTTSTITLEGQAGQWLTLPGPPIVSVASVAIDGRAVTDWRLRSGRLWRAAGWSNCEPSEVDVTQTHGLVDVPEDIVDLVCRMAAAALNAYRSEDGGAALGTAKEVTSERLGDWAVTYGADGRISEMDLPDYWRERLAARFGGGVTALVSR